MNSKFLTVVAAAVLFTGAAFAQTNNATPPASDPAAASSTAAPAPAAAAPAPAAPDVKAPSPSATPADNPYGLMDIIHKGNPVSLGVLALLAIMSVGSWYIFFVKYLEQGRILGQARTVERRFWSSGTLNEGIDKLPKNSMFRLIAESGVRASQGGTSLVGLNDWIAMSLTRQLDDANARLQGGIAFLASVGSTAPFVGLFGTVWGILQALIAIGVAGQASIDKVAGPVGEALIMTAIGLFVAVPAVLCYNFLVRRNKVIQEKLRGFAGDLQTYLISKSK
ncbi:MAG TPA: MotA/TolQ/ExbB proton channel family protein [Rhizomicrobium sp.]|nr:MotA/TolQ/ExbB proton channel family protein [Rhizomicrobium sp.]